MQSHVRAALRLHPQGPETGIGWTCDELTGENIPRYSFKFELRKLMDPKLRNLVIGN